VSTAIGSLMADFPVCIWSLDHVPADSRFDFADNVITRHLFSSFYTAEQRELLSLFLLPTLYTVRVLPLPAGN
jgi:hypothetical protein